MVNQECEYMMRDEKFLEERKNFGFDLVLAEPFIVHMCSLILPKHLSFPFVSKASTYNGLHIRSPALPSFFPRHFLSMDTERTMAFHARFSMLLGSIFLASSWFPMNRNRTLLQKYAPGVESWEDLLRESLLFFYESDHHFNNFLPSFPNHIFLAGSTCAPPRPLPKNILKFIDGRIVNGREPGVIVMTFGATAEFIPRVVTNIFFKLFASLNETIIAKFSIENDDIENDLLGHPSTKLFITHCGNNGQHEALYHGVPMLGFPLFAEQDDNSRRMSAMEIDLTMNVFTFTEEELITNIKEILKNPKYRNSIGRMSGAFKYQPMTAQERALFWMEHVIIYKLFFQD
ncbi:hypothetical protein HELRODRAFT_174541 [Helobdella robusta]|uniref:Glucuronosyltransferase n=1 Tax=Helobdella robusta TaxID=6412 RepID=T1F885_HELRO|nr:hypothetical protein HELRODRAFT_174541 [Helobdella robusta]ESO01583.1 hypothetical protein HELRODRAFT_174541 [Helobdella robusta]